MKNERHDHGHGELAEIWRNAHHRRTQDAWCWIARIFKKQRPFKLRLTEAGARLGETSPGVREARNDGRPKWVICLLWCSD